MPRIYHFAQVQPWFVPLLFLAICPPAIGAGKKDSGVPKGFRLETVAETPAVEHPVDLAFDDAGHLYVLDLIPGKWKAVQIEFRYRDGQVRRRLVHRKATKDRIRRLVRDEKTGRFNADRILLEVDDGGSILVNEGWLYLTVQGTVHRWRLADCLKEAAADPEPKRPIPEMVVQGLGGMAPGIARGLDGWLYLVCGPGDHHAEGRDGSRATVLQSGTVLRCRPDGSRLHVFATGLRHPRPVLAFDEADVLYGLGEPRTDRAMRPFAIQEGQDLGWQGERARRDQLDFAGLLHLGQSDFPEDNQDPFLMDFRGRFLVSNSRTGEAATWKLREDGSWRIVPFLEGLPGFHPSAMRVGPEGAVYLADPGTWNLAGLDGTKGVIRRLGRHPEEKTVDKAWNRWERLAAMKDEELLGRLGSTDGSLRQMARDLCARRGKALRPGLLKVLADVDLPARARQAGLGALQDCWNEEVQKAVLERLEDPIPSLRRQCIEALALNAPARDRSVHDALVAILEDRDPAVRRALVLALGKIAADGAGDVLVNVLRFDEGKSADFRIALLRALERTGREGIRQLLALADSGVGSDRDLVLEVYPALRSREAGEGLATLLKNYHLTPSQKVDLVRTYRKYRLDPPLSLKTLSDYLAWLPPVGAQANPETKEGRLQRDLIPVRLAAWSILAERGDLKEADLQARLRGLLAAPGPLRPAVLEALAETPLAPAGALLEKVRAESSDAAERAAAGKALEVLRKR